MEFIYDSSQILMDFSLVWLCMLFTLIEGLFCLQKMNNCQSQANVGIFI